MDTLHPPNRGPVVLFINSHQLQNSSWVAEPVLGRIFIKPNDLKKWKKYVTIKRKYFLKLKRYYSGLTPHQHHHWPF